MKQQIKRLVFSYGWQSFCLHLIILRSHTISPLDKLVRLAIVFRTKKKKNIYGFLQLCGTYRSVWPQTHVPNHNKCDKTCIKIIMYYIMYLYWSQATRAYHYLLLLFSTEVIFFMNINVYTMQSHRHTTRSPLLYLYTQNVQTERTNYGIAGWTKLKIKKEEEILPSIVHIVYAVWRMRMRYGIQWNTMIVCNALAS